MTIYYFVTGTDTGVGKTYVSCLLLQQWRAMQMRVLGVKPVASGCVRRNGILVNDDALQLQLHSSMQLPYAQINPYPLAAAIAPAFAAAAIKVELSVQAIIDKLTPALSQNVDVCLIEGAGGWLVPLNNHETMADLAIALQAEVILVVGMRLGCINHALLTHAALRAAKVTMHGWVANCLDPNVTHIPEMIATLSRYFSAPLLTVPLLDNGSVARGIS